MIGTMTKRGIIAAMLPLAFMAGATTGLPTSSAATAHRTFAKSSTWGPEIGLSYHPVGTFEPTLPDGCEVLSKFYAEQHAQEPPMIRGDSGAVVREVVVFRLSCEHGVRTAVRRGPWFPALQRVSVQIDPVKPPAPPCDISCPEAP